MKQIEGEIITKKKKKVINEKPNNTVKREVSEWIIAVISYTIVLLLASIIFKKTIYVDTNYFGFWAILASTIIYILNRTIKPVLVWLTLPLSAMTLGLFYPFINVFILTIVDVLLGKHFEINGIFMSFIVAIVISVLNTLIYNYIVKPLFMVNKK